MLSRDQVQIFQQFETPFYFYDLDLLDQTLNQLTQEADKHGYKVHYALKANYNDRILERISKSGMGADCVSGNEVKKALETGFIAEDIVFAGVGKTDKEIKIALEHSIFSLNVESLAELEVINEIAGEMGVSAPVSLRLNPDVSANSHHFISTGLKENKFGIHLHELEMVFDQLMILDHIDLIGLHFHIGSQITDFGVFKRLCHKINWVQQHFAEKNIHVKHINVGGGVGINYDNPQEEPIVDFKSYFQVFKDYLVLNPDQELHFELGRSIVAQCGSLISRVTYVKEGVNKHFLILDAGMNDLIRPALYGADHLIENLTPDENNDILYDVVGPVCESSDCFGKDVSLKETKRGDMVAIYSTGAYGQTMVSNYNLRDTTKEIYSDEVIVEKVVEEVLLNVEA